MFEHMPQFVPYYCIFIDKNIFPIGNSGEGFVGDFSRDRAALVDS